MCEIALCVKNLGNSGILAVDSHAPQQGDVIEVKPDGWSWGACELGLTYPGNPNGNHASLRIIKLPNVTVAQASTLLATELDVSALNPSPYLQYRGFYLDKTKIPPATMQALITYWNDDGRAQGFISLNYTAAQIQTIISKRTAIPF